MSKQTKLKCKKLLYTGTIVRGVWQEGVKVEECGKPNVLGDVAMGYLKAQPMCEEHRGEFLEAITGRNPYQENPKNWKVGDIVAFDEVKYRVVAKRRPRVKDVFAFSRHEDERPSLLKMTPDMILFQRTQTDDGVLMEPTRWPSAPILVKA